VGYYSASYRILDFLMYIPTLYTGAIFPVLSNFHVSSKESLIILYEKSFKYLFIISLPIAAAITILAQHIILILYQNSYYQSILCLQILIWSIPFLFLMSMFGTMFVSIKKAYIMVKITLFSMIFNITLNLIFIPTYSYIGAAILTVLTGILGCLISFYYLSQFIYEIRIKRIVLKPILSTIIVSLLLLLVHINFFLLIVIATILYLGLIMVFKTFTKDDYDIFIKLVPNFIKIYLIKMYNFYILIF
jgi:O-antigen/teichoic acid export membrane protein